MKRHTIYVWEWKARQSLNLRRQRGTARLVVQSQWASDTCEKTGVSLGKTDMIDQAPTGQVMGPSTKISMVKVIGRLKDVDDRALNRAGSDRARNELG